jgi:sugar phosphate isomerase/epimerase
MYLALNTFVYEVAHTPIAQTLDSARKFGFTYVEYAAYHAGDPTRMSASHRRDVIQRFKDHGLRSSQLLLAETEHLAASDPAKRQATLDYMKRCGEFQLELGGRQVLICWGCGVHEAAMMPEQAWVNTVSSIRAYAQWASGTELLIDLEMDPHVYFVVNSMARMAQVLEDVGMPNVFPNVDVGHMCITRESPWRLGKLRDRILHVHLSETDTYEHTNSILGTGKADFKAYLDQVRELGIEGNCARYGEPCVAGIEMGEPGGEVDDADRWVQESLDYLARILPDLTR